jgi:hypothetical protein
MRVCRQFTRRSESLVVPALGVVVLLAGCSHGNSGSIPVAGAVETTAGQFFSDFGSYLSPGQTKLVAIDTAPTGGMTLQGCANNTQQVPAMMLELPSGAWFAVWNDASDLFVFVDSQTADDLVIKWSQDEQGNDGPTFIGEGGGWEGVPIAFVEKLPDRWRSMHQEWQSTQAATSGAPSKPAGGTIEER